MFLLEGAEDSGALAQAWVGTHILMLLTRNRPTEGDRITHFKGCIYFYDFVQAVLICMAEAFSV